MAAAHDVKHPARFLRSFLAVAEAHSSGSQHNIFLVGGHGYNSSR